jgi:hypothetical protein
MACAEFEDRLVDYAELASEERAPVDCHLAACAGCQAFLEALAALDEALFPKFRESAVSPAFRRSVLDRARREDLLRRPSYLPEVLDFVGWAAVLAVAVSLLYELQITAVP